MQTMIVSAYTLPRGEFCLHKITQVGIFASFLISFRRKQKETHRTEFPKVLSVSAIRQGGHRIAPRLQQNKLTIPEKYPHFME